MLICLPAVYPQHFLTQRFDEAYLERALADKSIQTHGRKLASGVHPGWTGGPQAQMGDPHPGDGSSEVLPRGPVGASLNVGPSSVSSGWRALAPGPSKSATGLSLSHVAAISSWAL